MEDDPKKNPSDLPHWAKSLGVIVVTTLFVVVAGVLVPLAMKLLIWAWALVF